MLIFAADTHFDHCTEAVVESFLKKIAERAPKAVLLAGDISSSRHLGDHLLLLKRFLSCPIYFVLGNHDYYGNSIASVRERVRGFTERNKQFVYLTYSKSAIELDTETCLIGHDGWADGRAGDFLSSRVMLNDYLQIRELSNLTGRDRLEMLHRLGDEASHHVRELLPKALSRFRHVIFLTHVPPFEEASLYENKMSGADWSPHFVSKGLGVVLKTIMLAHPENHLTVLYGHTHHAADILPLPNLRVKLLDAVYGVPVFEEIKKGG